MNQRSPLLVEREGVEWPRDGFVFRPPTEGITRNPISGLISSVWFVECISSLTDPTVALLS